MLVLIFSWSRFIYFKHFSFAIYLDRAALPIVNIRQIKEKLSLWASADLQQLCISGTY